MSPSARAQWNRHWCRPFDELRVNLGSGGRGDAVGISARMPPPHLRSDTGEAAWERDRDRGWGGCGVGHFVLAPLNWFWRKDPASLKPFGQKGNSGGFCDTFPVIVFGQKLSPAGFVLLGGSTGGFLAMVRLL